MSQLHSNCIFGINLKHRFDQNTLYLNTAQLAQLVNFNHCTHCTKHSQLINLAQGQNNKP